MSNSKDLKRLKKRQAAERRFRFYGKATVGFVLCLLAFIMMGIVWQGSSALRKTYIKVDINLPKEQVLSQTNLRDLIYLSISDNYNHALAKREVNQLISPGADIILLNEMKANPDLLGGRHSFWLLASDEVDYLLKHDNLRIKNRPFRRLSEGQIEFLEGLQDQDFLKQKFNWLFFTQGDSRSPELAGIFSALMGSFYTIMVTLLLAFPLGVFTAIYLEEFASQTKLVKFFELNINNLASVPSIVFGLLGLAIFINVMYLPRSSAVVGGMTLALMVMPIIVIAARSALQTVPKSIRQAAEGLGASPVQVVFHHVVPLALPGILTGTILAVARALGESAALLMIGMVAFIVDAPENPMDPATVLPVQIFNWARNSEHGFVDHTAAAIMILLLFLIIINCSVIVLRKRYEQRW